VAGTQQNFDYDVGHDGIIGVKTGSDSAAQGCWAFAATRPLGGMSYPELGVVLGIPATSEGLLEPALSAGLALANALPATVREVTAVPAGTVVAYVRAPWRSAVAIRTARALKGLVSVGQTVKPRFELHLPAGNTVARGRAVGTLTAPQVTGVDTAVLVTGSSGPGPSLFWRLTRL
jgi:D-alanyl-D-alanine carboxypeptidase (penicillin-binding protein 5/6)